MTHAAEIVCRTYVSWPQVIVFALLTGAVMFMLWQATR